MTIVRLTEIPGLDYADISYSITLDAIWTDFEPNFGIVNACLPVLQPVFTKLSNVFIFHFSDLQRSSWRFWSARTPGVGTGSGDCKTKVYRPVDIDVYPLTDLNGTLNSVSGPDGSRDADSVYDQKLPLSHVDKITVKKAWDVSRQQGKNLQR